MLHIQELSKQINPMPNENSAADWIIDVFSRKRCAKWRLFRLNLMRRVVPRLLADSVKNKSNC